ncbi:transmembrane protein, putative [Medicago truncatula]|uniref:Transmembrane protein, putative n=1 Tax=Medicago truncatula TaxID=3880 RepID=G7J7W1_MEDTR|nr:transmembrane protein, putative [Medicago truncatula]
MTSTNVDVPEWLSGMTRNHVGSARAGSNPAVHAFFAIFIFLEVFPMLHQM